jgi:ferredoxin-NADP reductase
MEAHAEVSAQSNWTNESRVNHPERIDVRLAAIRYAARDTHLYEFERPDGKPLPSVEPGAHIDIILPNDIIRQYSLIESGFNPLSYVIGVKRDPASRGGSSFIHDQLRVGARVEISAPRNHFPLSERAPNTILIAGGIGVTPIYCMARRLDNLGRPWKLYYSCRSRADAAFYEELSKCAETTFNFDEENGGKFLDLGKIVEDAPRNSHLYCCGPSPMLRAFEAEATKVFPSEHIHVEYFTAAAERSVEGGYVVELGRSNREFVIPPGKTILEVLRNAGLDMAFSCEQGICGACETKVISGEPDHRDAILTESERRNSKTMMICCSGSKTSRLVLDV